jgi:phosphoglycerol transferase MdoB-like AlkP superfamily enzyme
LQGMWARMLNILIGTWLFLSAFALGMSGVIFWVTLLMGLAVVGLEAMAFYRRDLRFGTAGAGLVLLVTAFAAGFSSTSLTQGRDLAFWNNFFCGVALVVLSLAFSGRVRKQGPWVPRHDRHAEVR